MPSHYARNPLSGRPLEEVPVEHLRRAVARRAGLAGLTEGDIDRAIDLAVLGGVPGSREVGEIVRGGREIRAGVERARRGGVRDIIKGVREALRGAKRIRGVFRR